MIPFAPPAPPPSVVFEESTEATGANAISMGELVLVKCAVCHGHSVLPLALPEAATQIQIADDTATAVTLKSSRLLPMSSPEPSLKKKARQEKMGKLEREYPW